MNGGDGCTLWMYLIPLNYTLKMVRMINFMLCLFLSFWPRCVGCRIFVPQPGMEPLPPAVEAQSLNQWTARKVPFFFSFFFFNVYKFYTMCMLSQFLKMEKNQIMSWGKKFIKTNDFPPILVFVCLCSCCFLSSDHCDTVAMGEGNWILLTLSAKLESNWIEWVIWEEHKQSVKSQKNSYRKGKIKIFPT